MQIDLTGHHVELSDALRSYVHQKIERLQRHFEKVLDAHVILTVEKLDHKAEATMQLSGQRIYADAVAADMYAAIDALTDKLDRQLLKHKEKRSDHHRAEGLHAKASPSAQAQDDDAGS